MSDRSPAQDEAEASVDAFRRRLGPFVVAAEKTRMPMIFTDGTPAHPIVFANDAFLALTGRHRDEVLGQDFEILHAAHDDPRNRALMEAAFRGDSGSEPEICYRRKDGSRFLASVFVSPVCDETGTVVQHFASFFDLTKHHEDLARCKLLIDELNHRVKNTLSTVQSIVTQGLRSPVEPMQARRAIESRLLALSNSHDLLTRANWQGVGLRDLVDTAVHPFEAVVGSEERFTITGDNVRLSPNATLCLAIGLHELATNAVKYGAFSNDRGTIAIDWQVRAGEAGEGVILRWRERDGPPVMPPTHKGFGSWVIERGLAHELRGTVSLDYDPRGVICTIDIPDPGGPTS